MKYTDFRVKYTFKDGSPEEQLVCYTVPVDFDEAYDQAYAAACLKDMEVVDIKVKGLGGLNGSV